MLALPKSNMLDPDKKMMEDNMISEISKNWWLYLMQGLLGIAFGVLALVWPHQVWFALVLLFGVYVLLDCIFTIIIGFEFNGYLDSWWAMILKSVTGIAIFVLIAAWPRIAEYFLFYIIAAWAVIRGIFDIVVAIHVRRFIMGEWSMVFTGVLSIFFGIFLFIFPGPGLVSLVWVIGIYAIALGILQIIFAAGLNGLRKDLKLFDVPGL